MNANTSVERPSTATVGASYTTHTVTSRDGATIGYRQLGHGPGVILVHGAMESAESHMQLAEALADRFTVYAVDRRGRGVSGPYGANYSIQSEVDDLDALLTATGAHDVFGVSAGGLIALQAALTLPAISRVALYEPALIPANSGMTGWLKTYDQQIAQGKVAAALVTGMKGTQMGPAIFNLMPNWLLERMTAKMMDSEDKKAAPGAMTFRTLAPTLHYDGTLVAEMAGSLERFHAMSKDALLLGGSKSPAYLKQALDDLERTLPHMRRVTFAGLDHGGSGPTQMGGKPALVAQELRRFLA